MPPVGKRRRPRLSTTEKQRRRSTLTKWWGFVRPILASLDALVPEQHRTLALVVTRVLLLAGDAVVGVRPKSQQ
jgi:hypothetical protein